MNAATKVQAPFQATTTITLPTGSKMIMPPFPPLRLQGNAVRVSSADAQPGDEGSLIEVNPTAAVVEQLASVAVAMVQGALDTVQTTADAVFKIRSDVELSPEGRARRLAPVLRKGVDEVAMIWTACDEAVARVDAIEAKMLAVPELPSNAVPAALADIELRQWYRAQPDNVRALTLAGICQRDTKQRALRLALLRCPVGVADPEVMLLTDAWNDEARAAVPDTAVGVEIEREALDWCRHSLAVLAANMVSLVGGDRVDVLRTVLTSSNERAQRGFRSYGFTTNDVARMRLVIKAEQRADNAPEPAQAKGRTWNAPIG